VVVVDATGVRAAATAASDGESYDVAGLDVVSLFVGISCTIPPSNLYRKVVALVDDRDSMRVQYSSLKCGAVRCRAL
jgi:hypothetical protein